MGSVMFQKRRHAPAPSMLAASCRLGSIDCRPASQMTIDPPAVQRLMMISDGLLHAGSWSHNGGGEGGGRAAGSERAGAVSKSHARIALNTPCVGLKSHTHSRLAA